MLQDLFSRVLATSWLRDKIFQFAVLHATSSQDTIKQKKGKLIPNLHWKPGRQDVIYAHWNVARVPELELFSSEVIPKK